MKPFSRARRMYNNVVHGRFTCACCPGKEFRGTRAWNAHHLARHGGYWGSKAAGATGRKIGKATDAARRHARGWREAAGLIDARGHRTARGRSRPLVRGTVRISQLRQMHRHDRDHEKAEGHHRRAERAGSLPRQVRHHQLAANLRNRWPERQPQPAPAAQQVRVVASTNGTRPAPHRTGRAR